MDGGLNDKILKINHITILSQHSELSSLYSVDPIDPEPQERRGTLLVIIIINAEALQHFRHYLQPFPLIIHHILYIQPLTPLHSPLLPATLLIPLQIFIR